MFNHIMIGSNDIERSQRFYDAVLGVLGAGAPMRNRSPSGHMRLFYRHEGNTFSISEPIDGVPAIGETEVPGFILAAGFSGHGFGIGPGAGHKIGRASCRERV